MCNEAAPRIALGQLRDDWSETRIELSFLEGLPNMAPLDSVRITERQRHHPRRRRTRRG